MSLSLILSPQEFTTIISEEFNFGASLIASAKAWEVQVMEKYFQVLRAIDKL